MIGRVKYVQKKPLYITEIEVAYVGEPEDGLIIGIEVEERFECIRGYRNSLVRIYTNLETGGQQLTIKTLTGEETFIVRGRSAFPTP